jgi:hypothetical protein
MAGIAAIFPPIADVLAMIAPVLTPISTVFQSIA